MFKKAAVFTDIHFGLKGNSKVHNQDCENFIDWYIEQAKDNGCETGIFCGDWHHNRNSLNLTTMDATIRSMEKLGKAFKKFYFFDGNHDLYYKDKRDVNSTAFAKHIPGITFIDEVYEEEDVALVPWLVGDEWKKIKSIKAKYLFGAAKASDDFKANAGDVLIFNDGGYHRGSSPSISERVIFRYVYSNQQFSDISN